MMIGVGVGIGVGFVCIRRMPLGAERALWERLLMMMMMMMIVAMFPRRDADRWSLPRRWKRPHLLDPRVSSSV
jgi:hypothetical protein